MLKQRVITALVLGLVFLTSLFYIPFQQFVWVSLFIFAYGAFEWSKLSEIKGRFQQTLYSLGFILFASVIYFGALSESLWTPLGMIADHNLIIMLLGCCWWLFSSTLVFIYPRGRRCWQHKVLTKSLFGYLTLIPAWLGLLTLREWHYLLSEAKGAWLTLFVFAIVWSADTGAYFAGKKFGRHKLMPNVSPGKTLEGVLGGMVAVLVLTSVVLLLSDTDFSDWWILSICCALVGLVSVFGDLTESMLKRDAGIKDSGNILPGHGGLLDRMDSITAAIPVFIVLFSYFYL